ncbi:MAG: PorV/PorQ family protein [Elusimicrobia bacterium]|nr:PorV/PorQ family protein [Elusimicrobiota bacterium]
MRRFGSTAKFKFKSRVAKRLKTAVLLFVVTLPSTLSPLPFLHAAAGKSGGDFLRIVQSPRSVGMGESGVGLYGELLGALALNPAALALTDYRNLAFAYNIWIEDVSIQQAAYAHPLQAAGALAASVSRLGMNSIAGYNNSGAYTGAVDAGDLAVSVNYARRLTGPWQDMRLGLFAGAGLKYARESLDDAAASARLLDAGALWRSKVKGGILGLGLSAQSMGGKFKFDEQSDPAPRIIRVGAGYTVIAAGDLLSFALDIKKPIDSGAVYACGAEYFIRDTMALRAGYISGMDMGGGLRLGVGVNIRLIQFDYALAGYGKFGSVHRFSLSYKFGKPVVVTPHISPQQEQARWKVERARGFMRENRYYEAILELNGALDLDPGSIEALGLMKKAGDLVDTER